MISTTSRNLSSRIKVPVRKAETENDVTFQGEDNIMVVVEESTQPSVPVEEGDGDDGTTTTIVKHMVVVHGHRTNRLGDTYAFEEGFVLDPNTYCLEDFYR